MLLFLTDAGIADTWLCLSTGPWQPQLHWTCSAILAEVYAYCYNQQLLTIHTVQGQCSMHTAVKQADLVVVGVADDALCRVCLPVSILRIHNTGVVCNFVDSKIANHFNQRVYY